jgi:hypothetical protein
MICPVCGLELGVERQAGEMVLTYGIGAWVQRCTYQRGDPALCSNLMPTVLTQLETKTTPFRHAPRRSDAPLSMALQDDPAKQFPTSDLQPTPSKAAPSWRLARMRRRRDD